MIEFYLMGWKGIAKELESKGITLAIPTIKAWHRERLPIPFDKTYPNNQGRVVISRELLWKWYRVVVQISNKRSPALY